MIRVGFIINYNPINWLGGYNFTINLINAILLLKNRKIEPVLILGKDYKLKNVNDHNFEVIRSNIFINQGILERLLNKFQILILGRSKKYEEFFKKHKIDIISHNSFFIGKKSMVKSFAWIPDFQYLHIPENYSFKIRILKKINIILTGIHSTKIILSSKCARSDLKKISNNSFNKSIKNSFVFELIKKKNLLSLHKLQEKYFISKKFIYLPNQYFKHKNHILVLKSLNELLKKNKNKDLKIISSGHSNDHRDKFYFNKILHYLDKYNLEKNYIYLGVIPFNDVMSLIYHSIAVLNPSKFEGWSTSVEQAKAMNKTIMLSNIKVHKEQNPKNAFYFKPDNYKELAKIIEKVWFKKKKKNLKLTLVYKRNKMKLEDYAFRYQKIILNNKSDYS